MSKSGDIAPRNLSNLSTSAYVKQFQPTAVDPLEPGITSTMAGEDLFEAVLLSVSDGVIVVDASEKKMLWNSAAEQILGVSPKDIVLNADSLSALAGVPEGFTPPPTKAFAIVRAVGGEAMQDEEVLLHPKGREKPVTVSVTARPLPNRDGKPGLSVIVLRDVSSQKQTDTQLRRKSAMLELLQQITLEIGEAVSLDDAATLLLVGVARRLGWSVGHLYKAKPGTGDRNTVLVPSDVWYAEEPDAFAKFRAATSEQPVELPIGLPGGGVPAREATWLPDTTQDNDSPRAAVAAAHGLRTGVWIPILANDRVVAVVELFQRRICDVDSETFDLFAQLGRQLGRLVERLENAAEQERTAEETRHAQRLDALGRLAGGVAHDFNNLLTVMLGESQLALLDLNGEDVFRKSFENIERAGERGAHLTRQLLMFSRRQAMSLEILDAHSIISELLHMLARLIGEDIKLTFHPAADRTYLKVDRGQLEQVLTNLVVNARDAMPQGGVIDISTDNRIDSARASESLVITVKDSGQGMTEEVKQQIFEPFFTTKEEGRGTGLGLATSAGIIKQHGGFIDVETVAGKGTLMHISLPLARDEPTAVEPKRTHFGLAAGEETILYVEDDGDTRDVGVRLLEKAGYRVLQAQSPVHAMDILRDDPQVIDLLATDLLMPGMNGATLARRARRLRPTIRVLYITGYSEEVLSEKDLCDVGPSLLRKPFTLDQLTLKVRQVLTDDSGAR